MKADTNSLFIYVSALLLGLLFIYFSSKQKRRRTSIIYLLLAALPLSFVAGLRYNVGTDFDSYYEIYLLSGETDWKDIATTLLDIELGYKILCKLCYLFAGFNYTLNFFVVEFLTLFCALLGFYRMSGITKFSASMAFILFFLVYFPASLNIMRQMLATGILVLACSYLFEKKYLHYFIILLIGFYIHRTIVVGLLYPVILYYMPDDTTFKFKVRSRNLLYYTILVFGVAFIVPLLNMFVSFEMFADYGNRLETSEFGFGQIAIFLLSIGPVLLLCSREISGSSLYNYLKNLCILYLPLSVIGYFADWASRLNMYSQLSFILLICTLCMVSKHKTFVKIYSVFVFTLFFIYNILIKGQNEIFPYNFILRF